MIHRRTSLKRLLGGRRLWSDSPVHVTLKNAPRPRTETYLARAVTARVAAVPTNFSAPLMFQDLAVDDTWESPSRTVTQAEISLFAGLSGDFNPLHVDHEAAREGPFGQPVAHGLLGLSIASGLGTNAPRVDTMAFLEIRSWSFRNPIVVGDTIRVVTRVEALEPRSRGRRGVVTWHRQVVNQRGEVVQEGRTLTLVRGRASTADEATKDDPANG